MALFLFGAPTLFFFLAALLFDVALPGLFFTPAVFHGLALGAAFGNLRLGLARTFKGTRPGRTFLIRQRPRRCIRLLDRCRGFDGGLNDGCGLFDLGLISDFRHRAVIGLLEGTLAAHLYSDGLCATVRKALANLAGINRLVELELAGP